MGGFGRGAVPLPDGAARSRAGKPVGAVPVPGILDGMPSDDRRSGGQRSSRYATDDGRPGPGHPGSPLRLVCAAGRRDQESPDSESRPTFGARRRQRKARRPQWAQSRRTVRHLNVWTVAKVSLAFYLMLLVAVVIASVLLWYIADAFGSIDSIEKSVKTLFDLKSFTIHPESVAIYTRSAVGSWPSAERSPTSWPP